MSEGIFQFDMWGVTEDQLSGNWNWKSLKEDVANHGICNSLFCAQMPVACQTSDTKIRTSEGIKSFSEIMIENGIPYQEIEKNPEGGIWYKFSEPVLVETLNGYQTSDKIYYNGHSPVIEIEMEDGSVFKCSEEHKFLVKKQGEMIWVKAKHLAEDDEIVEVK
jgi:hypothetical protein